MIYFKHILFLLFLLSGLNSTGQIIGNNLVQNSSFEIYDTCPNSTDQLHYAKPWWGYSCDLYNPCGNMPVPFNATGFQYAHTGVSYAGFIIYSNGAPDRPDYREYIKTLLNDTLLKNRRYCTKLYINLAEYSYFYNFILLDSISLLFTQNQVQDTNVPIYNNLVQVNNSISMIDSVNWFKISNSFIANGSEQYLTIGNFQDTINWPTGTKGLVYLFVDDVSVCECSFNFSLGNDTTLCIGETMQLKVSMPNATYTWQDGSTDSIYKVTQTGTYWVKAYFADYNITTYDTINIAYINCDTTVNIISIYPNPAKDNLTIETNFNEEHRLEIINLLGQTIYTTYIYKKGIINTSNYSSGLYFLKIYTDKEIVVKKFVKE